MAGGRSSGSNGPQPWTSTPTPDPDPSSSSAKGRPRARACGEGHCHRRRLPRSPASLLTQGPGSTPEQEVHRGYLVPREGLQLTSTVPLVKEVLGSRRVEGGQWVPALHETSLTVPPTPAWCPLQGHGKPGSRANKATSSWEPHAPGPWGLMTASGQMSELFPDPPRNR